MAKAILITLMLTLIPLISAQHHNVFETPKVWEGGQKDSTSTANLLKAFKNGKTNGHLRYYFMHTDNAHGLMDFYANAVGRRLVMKLRIFMVLS